MWSFWKSKQTTEGFHILATAVGMICHDWCFLDPYTKGKKGKESKNEGWILQCWKNLGNPIKFLFKTLCQNMDIRAELNSKKSRLWFAFSKVTLHHSAINVHGWSWVEKNIFFLTISPSKSMDLWWFRERNHWFLSSNQSGNSSNFKMQTLPSADVYLKISPTIQKDSQVKSWGNGFPWN